MPMEVRDHGKALPQRSPHVPHRCLPTYNPLVLEGMDRVVRRSRKRWFNVLRVAICVAALWLVVRGVTFHDQVHLSDGRTQLAGEVLSDGQMLVIRLQGGQTRTLARTEIATEADGTPRVEYGLRTAWRNSRKDLLLLAVLIHFLVLFPQALRFRWLLEAQRIKLGYWECVKLSLAGNFLNFATPLGSNAGDVFKAYFVSLHTERKTEAVTTVVLDRLIGLGSMLLVVVAITFLSPAGSRLALLRPYMLGLFAAGALGIAIYFSPQVRRRWSESSWAARVPMFEQLQRVDRATRTLAGHVPIVVLSVLLTIGLQLMALAAYFAVAVAVAMNAHWGNALEYIAYFYTGVLVQALPGPPQGLGTVELTYRYFFAPFGSATQIVCMAFAIRVVVLICSLPGLLVTATGSYRPKDIVEIEPPLDPGAQPPPSRSLPAT